MYVEYDKVYLNVHYDPTAVMMMAEDSTNATAIYHQAVPDIFSLFNQRFMSVIQDFIVPYYFTKHAKYSLDILLEQMNEVGFTLLTSVFQAAVQVCLRKLTVNTTL